MTQNSGALSTGEAIRCGRVLLGVMPSGFFGTDVGSSFDVGAPLATEPLVRGRESRLDHQRAGWVRVMARMKEGQTLGLAEQALRGAQPQIREASLASGARPRNRKRYLAEPFAVQAAAGGTSSLRARYDRPLVVIMAIVGLVLREHCKSASGPCGEAPARAQRSADPGSVALARCPAATDRKPLACRRRSSGRSGDFVLGQ